MQSTVKILLVPLFHFYRRLVGLVPTGFKHRVKTGLLALALRLNARVSRKPLAEHIYRLVRGIARLAGVDAMFLVRADEIAVEEFAPESAVRLLAFYIRLTTGAPLPGLAYRIADHLRTEAEKEKTLHLLEQAEKRTRDRGRREAARMQILRLRNCSAKSRAAMDFCKGMIDDVLAQDPGRHDGGSATPLRAHGKKQLLRVKDIMDRHGKRFFLSSGTLLGAMREGDIIASDDDVDLGVFSDEVTKDELKRIFQESGFVLERDFSDEVAFSRDGVLIEFFLCHRNEDEFKLYAYCRTHEWIYTPFKLVPHSFLGSNFLVPDNHEVHLSENYGRNWRKRTLFFDWAFDVPCARYGKNFDAMLYLGMRFRNALRTNDRFVARRAYHDLEKYFGLDMKGFLGDELQL